MGAGNSDCTSIGLLGNDIPDARLLENTPVATRHVHASKIVITQMADNARFLMATRPFVSTLHFVVQISMWRCFDQNRVTSSRIYHFRTIHPHHCKMTAFDLGLGTTVRPEGCLGSIQYPPYLVKISDNTWYRTDEWDTFCLVPGLIRDLETDIGRSPGSPPNKQWCPVQGRKQASRRRDDR